MNEKSAYIYILTNKSNNVLYIGVTSDLRKRIWEHKNKVVDRFTKKYNIDKLVYFEAGENIESAIEREKQLKNWHREWEFNLIKTQNPEFKDLYYDIL